MRRVLGLVVVVVVSGTGLVGPASATTTPTRTLSVTGTEVGMYPGFDPAVLRYAATTTAGTAGTLQIAATTSDPDGTVLVDGMPAPATVTGLSAGDEVTVVVDDSAGPTTYSVMYLPAGFPALDVTTHIPDEVEPGLIGLTLNAFDGVQPAFGAIVDRNGVPVYAVDGPWDTDLKQQPNGEVTVSRNTHEPGHTGYSLAILDTSDRRLPEAGRRDVVGGLTDTDGHDSVRLADGSTILIGYEPRGDCGTGYLDATIQKQDAAGNVVFEWSSEGLADESTGSVMWPTGAPCQRIDYAHINSVVSVEDGDIIASFRHFSAAYRIATVAHDGYEPGDVVWRLGGRHSTFAFPNDAEAGPCAQHTVSQLPNGHILVFDNGTSGFCVDPNDPTGPTVARGYTRITEYALDLDATPTTATLVWSWPGDQSRYAMFAGSARRLGNGDTLIGWAADRSALATEVNSDGETVWEIHAADPPDGRERYATYRAELITALKPHVSFSGPADGATLVQGAAVPASGSCTDWAGTALAACTASGVVGGRLDTSVLGTRTWSLTATDGAGNETTQTRSYTVRPPARRPDGAIRKSGSDRWLGDGTYGSTTGQTVRQRAHRRDPVTAYWRVQNDGERADAFRLTGTAGTARFRVRYYAGGTDVTRAVVAGTYRTATLAPGTATRLRVEVTPTRRARADDHRTVTMRAASVTSVAVDRVATRVTARR